jgi:hypothetical protein
MNNRDVFNIGDYRLKHGFQRYTAAPLGGCDHKNLKTNDHGEVITCEDCGNQVSAYWVLIRFSHQYNDHKTRLESREKVLRESEEKGVTLLAAQKVESAWRKRNLAPACPHCLHIILPTDRFGDLMLSKENPEEARRSFLKTAKVLGLPTGEISGS